MVFPIQNITTPGTGLKYTSLEPKLPYNDAPKTLELRKKEKKRKLCVDMKIIMKTLEKDI